MIQMVDAEPWSERDTCLARLMVAAGKVSMKRLITLASAAEFWEATDKKESPPLRFVHASSKPSTKEA